MIRTARGLTLELAQLSDPGLDPAKQTNEDACGFQDTAVGFVAVLCDGMGGHLDGQQASTTAVDTILSYVRARTAGSAPAETLRSAIERAGATVFALGGERPAGTRPGATCVAALIDGQGAHLAHVGDSRIYLLRGGALSRITRDHSVVQQLLDAGMLTAEEAHNHPEANCITRALGISPELEVELRPQPVQLQSGDVLLLCSDGLTDMLADQEIGNIVGAGLASGLAVCCQHLIERANALGGYDNITAQLVRIIETTGAAAVLPTQTEALAATVVERWRTTVAEQWRTTVEGSTEIQGFIPPPVSLADAAPPKIARTVIGEEPTEPLALPVPSSKEPLGSPRTPPSSPGSALVLVALAVATAIVLGVLLWAILWRG